MTRKRRPKAKPKPAIPADQLETPAEPAAEPAPEPPERHCSYDVVHGDSWDELVTQVNIECKERGAIPTGGPVVVFTHGRAPYSQAVIYPVEQ